MSSDTAAWKRRNPVFALSRRTCRLGATWATPMALVAAACEATVPIRQVDRDALVALYEATDGPYWMDNTNWLSDKPLGEWYGVDTDADGRVVKISLPGTVRVGPFRHTHGLLGEIPPELGELSSLELLNLRHNNLLGEIPPELGELSNLMRLDLSYNYLSGEIPPVLGELSSLEGLNLFYNELSGEVPPELGDLSSLVTLVLSANYLSGEIPASFPALDGLDTLRFGDNQGLCAPNTSAFTSWFEGMSWSSGPWC